MSKLLEQLRERKKPIDLTCDDGTVWRVRRPVATDYWAIYGGVPTLAKADDGDAPSSSDDTEKPPVEEKSVGRRLYEALVGGIVDPETGKVEPVPYEDVPLSNALRIQGFLMETAPNTDDKTELVGRALHGSKVLSPSGLDGAAVGAASDQAA